MTIQLYAKDGHECIMFHDLVQADADAVQSNQFIVCHGDHMAVIDPGGMMTYNAIFLRRMQCFPKSQVDYIMASHADPDVVASLNRWLVQTTCKLVIPAVWSRFVPHFCTHSIENRLLPLPARALSALRRQFPVLRPHLQNPVFGRSGRIAGQQRTSGPARDRL